MIVPRKNQNKSDYPFGTKKLDRYYDHPFGKACYEVSDLIFETKILKFLTLEELFTMVGESNALRTGSSQITPAYLQTLKEMFEKVDPDLICWHLFHTLYHTEAFKNRLLIEAKKRADSGKSVDKKKYTLNAEQETCRYSCWWTLLHYYHVNVPSHTELDSKYQSGIFDEVKKKTSYRYYSSMFDDRTGTRENMLDAGCQFWRIVENNLTYFCATDKDSDDKDFDDEDSDGATPFTGCDGPLTLDGSTPAGKSELEEKTPLVEKTTFQDFFSKDFLVENNNEFGMFCWKTFGNRELLTGDRIERFAQREMAKSHVNDTNELRTLTFKHEIKKKKLVALENKINTLCKKIVLSRQNDVDLHRYMMSVHSKPKDGKHYLSGLDEKLILSKVPWKDIALQAREDVQGRIRKHALAPKLLVEPCLTKILGGSSEEEFPDDSNNDEVPGEETGVVVTTTTQSLSGDDDKPITSLRQSNRLKKKMTTSGTPAVPIIIGSDDENVESVPTKKRKIEDLAETKLPDNVDIGGAISEDHKDSANTGEELDGGGNKDLKDGDSLGGDLSSFFNDEDDKDTPKIDMDSSQDGGSHLKDVKDDLVDSETASKLAIIEHVKDYLANDPLVTKLVVPQDSNNNLDGVANLETTNNDLVGGINNLGGPKDDPGASKINLEGSGNNLEGQLITPTLTSTVPGNLVDPLSNLETVKVNLEDVKDGEDNLGSVNTNLETKSEKVIEPEAVPPAVSSSISTHLSERLSVEIKSPSIGPAFQPGEIAMIQTFIYMCSREDTGLDTIQEFLNGSGSTCLFRSSSAMSAYVVRMSKANVYNP
jgi:hypothetical protein